MLNRTLFIVLLILTVGFIASCGRTNEIRSRALLGYKYQDPESGETVTLRPSKLEKSDDSFGLNNLRLTYDKGTKRIKLLVDLKVNKKAEEIELRGVMADGSAMLTDVRPGKPKLKAKASCVYSDSCSEMYVNVYYSLNGKLGSQQFVVLRETIESKRKLPRIKKNSPPGQSPLPDAIVAGQSAKPQQVGSDQNVDLDDDHGAEEEVSVEGEFVSAPPLEDLKKELENLESDGPKVKDVPKPEKKKIKAGEILFNLDRGAVAKGRPWDGRIENSVSRLPDQGTGFQRKSEPKYNYGSGITIDFIKSVSDLYNKTSGCAPLLVNQISKEKGGRYGPHRSHQNGQDIDIGYIGLADFGSVLSGKITPEIMECNWKFFNLLVSQKLPDDKSVVSKIFVNPKVKRYFCKRAQNKNELEAGKEVLRHLYPWEGHTRHFHVRLRCSPNYEGCWNDRELDEGTGC